MTCDKTTGVVTMEAQFLVAAFVLGFAAGGTFVLYWLDQQ